MLFSTWTTLLLCFCFSNSQLFPRSPTTSLYFHHIWYSWLILYSPACLTTTHKSWECDERYQNLFTLTETEAKKNFKLFLQVLYGVTAAVWRRIILTCWVSLGRFSVELSCHGSCELNRATARCLSQEYLDGWINSNLHHWGIKSHSSREFW